MIDNTSSTIESEVRSYSRSFQTTFTNARESYLYDNNNRRYIDFLAGAGTLNYGHNPAELKRKIIEYISENGIVHGLDMNTQVRKKFLSTFNNTILKPRNMNYKIQFPGPTGTNAVEAAIKLARKIKQRETVLSFKNGFHGMTTGSVSVTANPYYHQVKGVQTKNPYFLPFDNGNSEEALNHLRESLTDLLGNGETPAAIIVETVQGEGGINVASDKWLKELENICRSNDIFLIIDDIQAGCGRCGRFFSFESAGIDPDFILLSKSISGYGLPLSLVLMKPELDQWEPGEYSGTFRSNNLAMLTATEALEHYWSDNAFQKELQTKIRMTEVFLTKLQIRFPDIIRDTRGKGMMWGIEFKVPSQAKKVSKFAFEQGLIIETSGNKNQVLKLLPPLTIKNEVLQEGFKKIETSLEKLDESTMQTTKSPEKEEAYA